MVDARIRERFDEGLALIGANRAEEALVCFVEVARAAPDNVTAQFRLGLTLLNLGRPAEAIESLRAAVALRPHSPAPFHALAKALDAVGQKREALEVLNDAQLALDRQGRREEALELCREMVRIAPDIPNTHVNVAGMLGVLRRPVEAVEAARNALQINPQFAPAHANMGLALAMLGQLDAAISHYDAALRLMVPGSADAASVQTNRGAVRLNLGRFREGWADYEHRRTQHTSALPSPAPGPQWRGTEDIAGKTLLVHSEQGLGDTLQFVRFLPWLRQAGARVLFMPQRPLLPLMRQLAPEIGIIAPDTPLQSLDYDLHCRLLSLAGFFGVDADHPPPAPPYLTADPERTTLWRGRLGDHGFRIGLCWQGSAYSVETGRTLPLGALAPLAELPDVRLISLQVGPGAEQASPPPTGMPIETLGADFDADGAFVDTAAVIAGCDLVISVDTSVVHLAGALNRPVWILLPTDHCWRWMGERADTPWYPEARLFRQTERNDWAPVIAAVQAALAERLSGGQGVPR